MAKFLARLFSRKKKRKGKVTLRKPDANYTLEMFDKEVRFGFILLLLFISKPVIILSVVIWSFMNCMMQEACMDKMWNLGISFLGNLCAFEGKFII